MRLGQTSCSDLENAELYSVKNRLFSQLYSSHTRKKNCGSQGTFFIKTSSFSSPVRGHAKLHCLRSSQLSSIRWIHEVQHVARLPWSVVQWKLFHVNLGNRKDEIFLIHSKFCGPGTTSTKCNASHLNKFLVVGSFHKKSADLIERQPHLAQRKNCQSEKIAKHDHGKGWIKTIQQLQNCKIAGTRQRATICAFRRLLTSFPTPGVGLERKDWNHSITELLTTGYILFAAGNSYRSTRRSTS